jgi:hypothetical protein
MLRVAPADRLPVAEVKAHPWVALKEAWAEPDRWASVPIAWPSTSSDGGLAPVNILLARIFIDPLCL